MYLATGLGAVKRTSDAGIKAMFSTLTTDLTEEKLRAAQKADPTISVNWESAARARAWNAARAARIALPDGGGSSKTPWLIGGGLAAAVVAFLLMRKRRG